MNRIMGVSELRRSLRAVLEEVAHKRIPYVLTRGGRPEVALVPYDEYMRFRQLQEKDVLARLDRLMERRAAHSEAYSDEQVAADICSARAKDRGRKATRS